MGLLSEIGRMHYKEEGSYSIEVVNNIIRVALLEANISRLRKSGKILCSISMKVDPLAP